MNCQIRFTCLSFRPHMNCQIRFTCLSFRPHMNCQIRLTYFSFRPYLKVGQGSPESRSVQNNLAFYPPPPHGIQPKNNLHSEEENGRNPLPYHDEIILRTGMPSPNTSSRNILCFHFLFSVVLRRLSVFFECPDPLPAYTVILPPFRGFSLFCRRFPTHFSPASATGFLCLFSCFPAVEKSQNNVSENIKTYIYKNKFIFLFSYLSAQIFFYYNLHLLI